MPKFKVLGGFHDHTEPGSPSHGKRYMGEVKADNGTLLRAGEILHSKFDLRQDFANKFELVPDSTPLSPARPVPGMERVHEELARIEAQTPLKPTVSTPPPAVPATLPVSATETPVSGATAGEGPQDPDDASEGPTTPQGKDVTKQFPKALEEDYKVFKDGKTFGVYNADDMTEVVTGIDRNGVDEAIAADLKRTAKA